MIDGYNILSLLSMLLYPLLSVVQFAICRRAAGSPGGSEMMYGSGITAVAGLVQAGLQYTLIHGQENFSEVTVLFTIVGGASLVGIVVFLVGLSRFVEAARTKPSAGGNMLDRY